MRRFLRTTPFHSARGRLQRFDRIAKVTITRAVRSTVRIPTELRLKFAPQRGQEAAVAAIIPPQARHDVTTLMILPRGDRPSVPVDNTVTDLESAGCDARHTARRLNHSNFGVNAPQDLGKRPRTPSVRSGQRAAVSGRLGEWVKSTRSDLRDRVRVGDGTAQPGLDEEREVQDHGRERDSRGAQSPLGRLGRK